MLGQWKQDHQQVIQDRSAYLQLADLANSRCLHGVFFRFHRTPRQHKNGDKIFFDVLSSWSTDIQYAKQYGKTGYCIHGWLPGVQIDDKEAVLGVYCLVVRYFDSNCGVYLCDAL